ncbi:RNA polymerase Rpb6, partial [bacterium]
MSNNKPVLASSTVTRDLRDLDKSTDNIYESLVVMSKRANQISNNIKEELSQKLSEFTSSNDNLEEVFENREQIEISKQYEKMPKP